MMYPIFLNLAGKECLVVGGGRVALRKVLSLLRSEARVTVITKECCRRLHDLKPKITLHIRPFDEQDLERTCMLVIGATDDQVVNRTIFKRASALNIPCNIVDQPELCSFIVPAQVRRGAVNVAISTSGVSPRFSRYLKNIIADTIEPLHGDVAEYLGDIRHRIKTELPDIRLRSAFWERVFADDPVEVIRKRGWDALRTGVERTIGEFKEQIVP